MNFNFGKLSAWLIVIAGLSVIAWTIFSSCSFFTGQKSFPQVFRPVASEEIQEDAQKKTAIILPKDTTEAQVFLQSQAQQLAAESISKLFPAESVFQFLNMTSWIAFASFLVFAGAQIAGIGVKLLVNKS
jgi:hypothetical protein